MTPPPIPIPDPARKDREHLRLLAAFHFVLAGLTLLFIPFLFLHYTMMQKLFMNEELWKSQPNATPPPKEFFEIFIWFYWFGGAVLFLVLLANVISGICILGRRCRIASLIVAGINCLQFPFGTVLGVFTFIVLLRESVTGLYREAGRRS